MNKSILRNISKSKLAILTVFIILFLDQSLKIWIKTHMFLGQEIHVFGNWFIIHFTENNGMAFGYEFAGNFGKIFLSLFRIFAVAIIAWYLHKLIKSNAPTIVVICVSLIFAGAIGNIIDSAFYGMIFNESYYQIASLFPEGGGYSSFLHGKVVDMLYFPVISGHFPQWFPFWKSQEFIFFRPIFNIADSSISIGVFLIIFFQRKFFKDYDKKPKNEIIN
ncbi:MAG: lipoprotein signal peptidase [Bacteroidetes bacterium]|nr:lipoprotein signal peptidase [Bacteroidota bacterium]